MSSAVDVDSSPEETRDPAGPAPRRRRNWGRTVARGIGQTLITFGIVALLLVVYQLWVTNIFTEQHQHQLVTQIQQQWQDHPTVTPPQTTTPTADAPAVLPTITTQLGQPFALVHIPRLNGNWAVVEGVSQAQLAKGPGHYIGTALPGQQGNFAIAGHAISSVFLHLAALRPGDPIVIETDNNWFVYRVLGDPATGSFTGDPSGIPGQEVVLPTGIQVISPTPDGPADGPATGAYLTLTTCTPATTATHRLIVHARLDGQPISKASEPAGPPALHG